MQEKQKKAIRWISPVLIALTALIVWRVNYEIEFMMDDEWYSTVLYADTPIRNLSDSPMNMYSSCNLFARSDMASIVDSLVAPMSLINALIVSICLKNSEQVVENIEKINTFVDNFEYSGNDEINMLDENVVNELRKCMDNAAIDDEK